MLTLQPPDDAHVMPFLDGGVLYACSKHYPKTITSFKSSLDLSFWRAHYKPFACAIINPRADEALLIRDHLGMEPLYYCHHLGKKLIFGQTIPEILQHLPNTPPLLENQIDMLFSENKIYSDETIYQGIYRVEPGYCMHFKPDGSIVKKAFWQLDPHRPLLHYTNDHDYRDHFAMLINEALVHATENQTHIAAEFSAGLDSSAVYCAAANINLTPKLYMHVARPGTKSADVYQTSCEEAFIKHYQLNDIQRIGADNFDPLQVLTEYAAWFAGPAPYLFPMFANPLHRAVEAGQHAILLSGFGGDQCVSGQLAPNFFLPELMHLGEYRQAWRALGQTSPIKKPFVLAKHMHRDLYAQALHLETLKQHIGNILRPRKAYKPTLVHPYKRMYYHSAREAEWALLQGPESHEVRMRIEYSSIVSKKMGFEYRYPLLYPKLLEFMLSIPTHQKRRDGHGRYFIRQYLSDNLPGDIFGTYRKQSGLGIVPSTFDLYQKNCEEGCYQQAFKNLPYAHRSHNKHKPLEIRNHIKGFMFKAFESA